MNLIKLAGLFALLYSTSVMAIEPFTIKDIRVEGIQRTEPGTVFSYLPVKVGDTMDDEHATASLHALFATGFFKDVELKAEGSVLIVVVKERPTVASVEINGVKDFPKSQLLDNLKYVGLAEGRIFDKSALEKSENELKRQYIARGKYSVVVKTTVKDLERNRVAVSFNVEEGSASKIRLINIVGNKAYSEKDLLDTMQLTTPGWFSWFSKNDQYSKQKLSADMESLRTFYMNSGYMDFTIESTQVSISPDKKDIFITLNISEGDKYTVSDIKVAGTQAVLSHEEMRKLIGIQPGDVFSRDAITESTRKIGERLGEEGYAFANVNAAPEIDKAKHQVAFTFVVDPLQRAYIRRINITGNDKTRDEVIRREFRQMEGGWFATSKIKKSKQRLDRLGFFSDVNVDTSPVQGTGDQLDLNLKVAERSTGNFSIGAGYSSLEKLTLMAGVTQSNVFGTGNSLSTQINTSKLNQVYSVSYTNPYYTDDGISRGFDVYKRRTNATQITVSQYTSDTYGAGVRYGVPITDDQMFHYGLSFEQTTIGLTSLSPQRFVDYINTFGPTNRNELGTIGWSQDTRDSAIFTTEGVMQNSYIELSIPSSDQRYYKWTYQNQWFHPLSRSFTLMTNANFGVAGGYGGMPLPFFKNFYAGGVGSVRGYDPNSLGPRDINNYSLGGNKLAVGNIELLFPMPGMEKEKSLRLSAFLDGGEIFGSGGQVPGTDGMRYSTGLALTWFSPAGPLKLSWARPLNKQPQDKIQNLQFTLGSMF
ncbi:outer membrane protein assembly factor BamA [Sideroxydans lithotrophicus]|uniref:Outer membrane protein assembly factor BamA n=1 Tax=Sideroxydans lithotrophicus (strain ES-1) TaxID=580332 RepID=D5CSE0_SIDLE|nr:outer membrane protein assembly factor BamA [Sideroxydans lithotrophicus]ADE11876.1 outer membrane protein assembly complex, YaeT protein [Sideroxydans lithotrophicus ES-1]